MPAAGLNLAYLRQEKSVRGVQDLLKNISNNREKEERESIFSNVTKI